VPASFFAEAYDRGTPPWDIGRHQPVFEKLADAGDIRAPVLDAGCGTGENALYLAARGYEVVGVDAVELAVHAARRKAARRGLAAEFLVGDALALGALDRRFATVIDSGLFHTFDDQERPRFVDSLATVLQPGGHYFMLCFSELETREGGPRRVTQAEIRAAFDRPPFRVLGIEAAEMETNFADGPRRCWLARIERV
jgi:2-polyprenyl-3-methyl-5-hydroxy-6-metoxy-1,4-benzoquinol methylase